MAIDNSIPSIRPEDFEEIIESYEKVIIDFSSEFCAPCLALGASLTEIAPQYPEIRFFKVDIDAATDLADSFEIDSIPCLIFFRNSKKAKQVIGYLGYEKLENDILSFLDMPGRDLTEVFADGELWYLDDMDVFDVINNVEHSVLLFVGSDHKKTKFSPRNMRTLAKQFKGKILFGIVEYLGSSLIRSKLKIPRKQDVIVFMKKGVVSSRKMDGSGMRELRQGIAELTT